MTLCGLRCGEMQALRVGDIHLDDPHPHILVREQWKRRENRFGPLKNRKPLRVPIIPMLGEYLSQKLPKEPSDPQEFVVKGKKPGQHISHAALYTAVKKLAKVDDLTSLCPHELRHTCTEYWKDKGANAKDLQNLLNHSSEASTRKYEHRVDDRLNRIAASIRSDKKRPALTVVI